jgi:hypothetical protein
MLSRFIFRKAEEGFVSSRSGAALIEFAMVVPFLMALLLGTHETTRLLRASHHMSNYVNTTAYDLAGVASDVSQATLRSMVDRVSLMVPEIMRDGLSPWSGSPNGIVDIGFTMVRMTPRDPACQSACNYKAMVAWSFGNLRRPCGEQDSMSSAAQPTSLALPIGAFQSGALAVVDLATSYQYRFASVVPSKEMRVAGYFPVRNWRNTNASPVPLLTGSDDVYSAERCTNF